MEHEPHQDEEAATRRGETVAEREDRKFTDLLQEMRVIQTGAQLIAGFLLTLPFQGRFEELSAGQERFYLGLVVLAALVTVTVLTPVAVHRRLSGHLVKGRVVEVAHVLMQVALALLGLLMTGIVVFVFDVVVDLSAALAVGAGVLAVLLVGLIVLPAWLVRTR